MKSKIEEVWESSIVGMLSYADKTNMREEVSQILQEKMTSVEMDIIGQEVEYEAMFLAFWRGFMLPSLNVAVKKMDENDD